MTSNQMLYIFDAFGLSSGMCARSDKYLPSLGGKGGIKGSLCVSSYVHKTHGGLSGFNITR